MYFHAGNPRILEFDIGYNIDVDNTTFFWSINNVFDKSYERPDGYNQYDRTFNLGFRKYF